MTEEISQVKTGHIKGQGKRLVASASDIALAPPHPRFQCCGMCCAINLRNFRCSHALVVLVKTQLVSTLKLGARGFLQYWYIATSCASTCENSSVNSSIFNALALMLGTTDREHGHGHGHGHDHDHGPCCGHGHGHGHCCGHGPRP